MGYLYSDVALDLALTQAALAMPKFSEIVTFGDSFGADGIAFDAASGAFLGRATPAGIGFWLSAKSHGDLRLDRATNVYNVNGSDSAAHVTQAVQFAAAYRSKSIRPNLGIYHGPTNDPFGGVAYATTIANVVTVVDTVLPYLNALIMFTIPPRYNFPSDAARTVALRYNRWLRAFSATRPKVLLFDFAADMVDTASATAFYPIGGGGSTAAKTGVTQDGTHLNPLTAHAWAEDIWQAIRRFVPRRDWLMAANLDVYDATNNPAGNLLANGVFSGTGGTGGSATGASGTYADGWSHYGGSAGVTITLSKSSRSGRMGVGVLPTQKIAISAAAATRGSVTLWAQKSMSLPQGGYLDGACAVKITKAIGLNGVSISTNVRDSVPADIAYATVGGTVRNSGDSTLYYPWPVPPDDYLVMRPQQVLIPASGARAVMQATISYDVVCDIEVELFGADLRLV